MVPPYKKEFVKDALFISYTGLSDFIKCPRSYYLKNLYRDPKHMFRLQIISPFLTLGATIHDTIKWFLEEDFKPTREETIQKFRSFWRKYRLKRGGFSSLEEEGQFGQRGLKMLNNFLDNADILEPATPFLHFPKFKLLEDVFLTGNMDFIGECEDGSLHVVDFKTGTHDEDSALQLYIYAILAEANLQREVSRASFWYLDRDDGPKSIVLDPLDGQIEWLKNKGQQLKDAIKKGEWICVRVKEGTLCKDCRDYQALVDGQGEFLFPDYRYKKSVYFLPSSV